MGIFKRRKEKNRDKKNRVKERKLKKTDAQPSFHSPFSKGDYKKAEAVTRPGKEVGLQTTTDVKTEFNVGDVLFNRYQIIDIKKGGMGLVYIALDVGTGELIALKTFQKQFLQDERVIDSFMREAETWINLGRHTNLVWAQNIARIDGKPYIFIEYIDGGNLDDRIKKDDIPIEKALDYAIQFCTGMNFAYNKMGIVHRDIKPANIMLTSDDVVKITDLGLVKSVEYANISGFLTPAFASPEQISERNYKGTSKIDTHSDIYSFGLVLYNMLTRGNMPFTPGKGETWENCHISKQPVDIREYNSSLPEELRTITMKCLSKSSSGRWPNFFELQKELIRVFESIFGTQYIIQGKEKKIDEHRIIGSRVELGRTAELYGKYDAAIQYYEKALNGCLERGDKQGQSACYINMGMVALDKSDNDLALGYFNKSLQINLALGDKHGESGCYMNMGIVARRKGDYDQARGYYNKSLKIGLTLGDKEVQSKCYTNMGSIAQRKGDYDQALEYFNKSLQINLALGDKQGQSGCYMNMGVIVKIKGNYKQAFDYYNKSLQIDLALGHKQGQCKCYGDLGNVAAAIGDYNQALEYYNQSLKIALALGDKEVQSMLYTNLGAVAVSKSDFNQALGYFNKSLQIKIALEDISGQSVCYNNMGIIARKKGDHNKALECYNNSLRIALTLGDKQLQSACYQNMGNVAADKGDYRRALEYFNKELELKRIMGLDTSELEKYIWEVKRMI